VLETIPPEDVMIFTSMSANALSFRDDDILNRVVFFEEYEGASEIDYVLRIALSEGVVTRSTVIKDESTGELRTIEKSIRINSSFVLTTTRTELDNEVVTRFWNLYADESVKQTKRVLEYIKQSQSREYRHQEGKRKHIIEVLRAAQQLLKTVEIEIPYAQLLEFPSQTTRNRRDLGRFISFIKVIAFLRQYQKEVKTDSCGEYIEADLQDYFLAYTLLLPILRNTLDEITPRGMAVLEVCCLIQNEKLLSHGEDKSFTVKEVQDKGAAIGIDMKNVVTLRQQLQSLTNNEYLELISGAWGSKGGRLKFKVICGFDVECGEVKNIKTNNTGILTPDQLATLISSDESKKK
jgi:hypothetical protein